MEWIKINNSDDLPKFNSDEYDGMCTNELRRCIVCVRRYRDSDEILYPEYTDYVVPSTYDTENKVWNFDDAFAINALINGNEEYFDYKCIVTHWMPFPKPPEKEKENDEE